MSIPASRPDNLQLRNELTSRSVSYSKREEGERRREGREVKVVGRGEEERGESHIYMYVHTFFVAM